jgi:hypothetical protein
VRLTIDRDATSLLLPVLEGPSPIAERPSLPSPRGPQAGTESARGEPLDELVWAIEHDVAGKETRAVARYGGSSPADDGVPAIEWHHGGMVGVSTEDPARAWVDAEATYTIAYPEATVSAAVRSRIDADAEAYHLHLEIDTAEDGEPRWSRRFDRRVTRRLQ